MSDADHQQGTSAATGTGRRPPVLWIVVAVLAGLLLIVGGILLGVLLGRGDGQPTASTTPSPVATRSPSPTPTPTPSATPTPTPTPTPTTDPAPPPPPPDPNVAVINTFTPTANPEDLCHSTGSSIVEVTFGWSTTNAVDIAFGIDTMDAFVGPYATGLPASGTITVNHPCGDPQRYTLSVRGADGVAHHEYWTYNQ